MSKAEMLDSFSGNVRESLGVFKRPEGATTKAPASQSDRIGRERSRDAYTIDIDRIVPDPDQPRKEFDPEALHMLAESLKTRGQLQPIQVRWDAAADRYVVIMGERRWRAAQVAGLKALSCIVREGAIGDGEKLSIQLIENCLREDLKPVEQATAFRALMDREGWTQDRLASELAVSQTVVARALSLLRLPEAVRYRVEQGALSPSHAHEIAKLDDPHEQVRLAEAAAEQGLTRDDVAKQVRRPGPSMKKKAAVAKKLPPAMVWRANGFRLELTKKAGVDLAGALAMLEEAAAKVRASLEEEAAREAV